MISIIHLLQSDYPTSTQLRTVVLNAFEVLLISKPFKTTVSNLIVSLHFYFAPIVNIRTRRFVTRNRTNTPYVSQKTYSSERYPVLPFSGALHISNLLYLFFSTPSIGIQTLCPRTHMLRLNGGKKSALSPAVMIVSKTARYVSEKGRNLAPRRHSEHKQNVVAIVCPLDFTEIQDFGVRNSYGVFRKSEDIITSDPILSADRIKIFIPGHALAGSNRTVPGRESLYHFILRRVDTGK